MTRKSPKRRSGDLRNQLSGPVAADLDTPESATDGHATDDAVSDETVPSADVGSLAMVMKSSTDLLDRLVNQFSDLSYLVAARESALSGARESDAVAEVGELRQQVFELQERLAAAEQQNDELALRSGSDHAQESESGTKTNRRDVLSWEDRKEMILQQMEEDTFDAESFIASLAIESDDETCDPIAHVQQLHAVLQQRDQEIHELQCSLQLQTETGEAAIATNTAAITEMIDNDDFVREEREKLRKLRAEWEERFREGEIAASLERAKLSRDRRELAQQDEKLQEQLAHLRRQAEEDRKAGVAGARRWLAKLGLDERRS